VAAIEACYLVPIEPSSKRLGPSELLTLAFNHATENNVLTLKVFILTGGSKFSDVIESLRDGVSSNIRLGVRIFICRSSDELAELVRKEGCSVLYVPGDYAKISVESLKLPENTAVKSYT